MIDIRLIVKELREAGHTVEHSIPLPENAGEYEFIVDGQLLLLEEARALIDRDAESRPVRVKRPHRATTVHKA